MSGFDLSHLANAPKRVDASIDGRQLAAMIETARAQASLPPAPMIVDCLQGLMILAGKVDHAQHVQIVELGNRLHALEQDYAARVSELERRIAYLEERAAS